MFVFVYTLDVTDVAWAFDDATLASARCVRVHGVIVVLVGVSMFMCTHSGLLQEAHIVYARVCGRGHRATHSLDNKVMVWQVGQALAQGKRGLHPYRVLEGHDRCVCVCVRVCVCVCVSVCVVCVCVCVQPVPLFACMAWVTRVTTHDSAPVVFVVLTMPRRSSKTHPVS
jgi:hypothetical protein